MKKLQLLALAALLTLTHQQVLAQCTPKSNVCTFTRPDRPACISPEVAPEGEVDKDYTADIQLNFGRLIPTGAVPAEVYLNRVEVVSVDSLPDGLTVVINSANAADNINGKDKGSLTPLNEDTPIYGCGRITGKPTKANETLDSAVIVINVYIKFLNPVTKKPTGTEIDPNSIIPFNPYKYHYKVPVVKPSAVDPASDLNRLVLAPNPTQDVLTVRLPDGLTGRVALEVLGLDGRTLVQTTVSSGEHRLSVADLPSGVYFVKLSSDGRQVARKFIKE